MAGTLLDSTLSLTTFLASVAVLVQSFEYISLRKSLSRLQGTFSHRFFALLVATQILLSVLRYFFPLYSLSDFHDVSIVLLFVCTLLISIHLRGSFNGGADSMTLVVLSGLSIAALFSQSARSTHGALIYIAVQSLLSYLVAGVAKLRKGKWRSGQALASYLQRSSYDVPQIVRRLARKPSLCFLAAWTPMLFELALLPALFNETALLTWMATGLLFHLANFAIFGLNRFFFVWLATYPALFYLGDWIGWKAS